MVYINPVPVLYLSGSAGAAYLGVHSALRALPNLIKPIFGSTPLEERIQMATKETISGKLSISNLVFGPDSLRDRVYSVLSGSFFTICSAACFFLAYNFFFLSFELNSYEVDASKVCFEKLNPYINNHTQAVAARDYSAQNFCEFNQQLWDSSLAQNCYRQQSVDYSESAPSVDCNDLFLDLSSQAYSKTIIPQEAAENIFLDLREEKAATVSVCDDYLFEAGHDVNKKCNPLFPFVGFDGKGLCDALQTPGISLLGTVPDSCLGACKEYERKIDTVYKPLQEEIPRLHNIVLNCTKVLQTDIKPHPAIDSAVEENRLRFTNSNIEFFKKKFYTFGQNVWRNISSLVNLEELKWYPTEKWNDINPEKDPYRLEKIKKISSLRRTILRNLRAVVEHKDTLDLIGDELTEEAYAAYQQSKNIIAR